eukprot:gene21879-27954_t
MDEQSTGELSVSPNAVSGGIKSVANPALKVSPTNVVVTGGVRDTREVLTALSLVNSELEAVDRWLGEQIERLSEIQTNLHTIEEESGALETSWQNLNTVQQVIGAVVQGYSIEAQHQELLGRLPEEYFGVLLRPTSTSLVATRSLVSPLNAALAALRDALNLKNASKAAFVLTLDNSSTPNTSDELKATSSALSPAQWKQIQTIAAVTSQRAKLAELADTFCTNYGDFSLGLFDVLLKHKALSEGAVSINIKQFNYQPIVDSHVANQHERESIHTRLSVKQNQFLVVQGLYHNSAEQFLELIDHFVELSPNYTRPLCEAYVRASQERLFVPLAKTLFKDLQAAAAVSSYKAGGRVSMSSCAKYHLNAQHGDLVAHKFLSSTGAGLSAWMAVRVALLLLSPVIESEEKFVKSFFHLDARQPVRDEIATDGSVLTAQVSLAVDMTTFASSRLGAMLESLFEGVLHRFETALLHCGSAGSASVVGGDGGVDELSPFVAENLPDSLSPSGSNLLSGEEPSLSPSGPAGGSMSHSVSNTLFLSKTLQSFKQSLFVRLNNFVSEQISWINAQKADPKAPTVQAPFARFPTLILQLYEMADGLHFDHLDDVLHKLAKELFNWLGSTAKQSDKYADKTKIINYTFFEQSLHPLGIEILENFITYAGQQRVECMTRYVNWMVSYEFPALSALAVRMDGLGDRVNEEELSLYIRRKDVLNVVKEVEVVKTLEANILTLRRRLEKHFQSEHDTELNLVSNSWTQIKQRVVRILTRLEEAASASYQIQLDVGPKTVRDLFDKYATAAVPSVKSIAL